MVGTVADGQLNVRKPAGRNRPRLRFVIASPADDAAIRRLLRETPMRGAITLSFEREPNYFHGAALAGAEDQTILAFDGDHLICMGRCSTRPCWIDGRVQRVGYLAELRLAATAQGRFDALRDGYRFFRELHRENRPALFFTSIASDNERARRLLECGVKGLPCYSHLSDFVTLVIPVARLSGKNKSDAGNAASSRAGNKFPASAHSATRREHQLDLRAAHGSVADDHAAELAAFLNEQNRDVQLAPAWTPDRLLALASHGLPLSRFQLFREGGRLVACATLWDQRSFRQTVIRDYTQPLRMSRPALNFFLPLLRRPRLPAPGSVLAHAFVSPLAIAPQHGHLLPEIISMLRRDAAASGLDYVTLGFAANDPRLGLLRRHFPVRSYTSRLYRVSWPDEETDSTLESRLCRPDIAFL